MWLTLHGYDIRLGPEYHGALDFRARDVRVVSGQRGKDGAEHALVLVGSTWFLLSETRAAVTDLVKKARE